MKVYLAEKFREHLTNRRWRAGFRHPKGYTFNEQGVSDWPDDAFTKKRIREGDMTTTPPEAKAEAGPAPAAQAQQETEKPTRRSRSE